jgi:hypothetical protein
VRFARVNIHLSAALIVAGRPGKLGATDQEVFVSERWP